MITEVLKTNSGPVTIRIPQNMHEITLGQLIEIGNESENSNVMPMIPGLTREVYDNIIYYDQVKELQERIASLVHQINYCYNEASIPEYVVLGTKKIKRFGLNRIVPNKVKVLKNLGIAPAGAYLECRDLIAAEANEYIKNTRDENWKTNFKPSNETAALILAHYFYCAATGKDWNENDAADFKSEVLKLSIQDALPIARYFFLKYPDLSKTKIGFWQAVRLKLNKKLALRNLRNSGTRTQ